MVVVVEGPDCAGKSTYCKWLEETHGFQYVHFGPFDCNPLPDYLFMLSSIEPGQNVVIDRFYPSETIYRPIVFKAEDRVAECHRMLDRILIYLSGVMVIVRTPEDIVKNRLFYDGNRDEMDGVRENWREIWEAYDQYVPTDIPYLYYAGVPHSAMPSPNVLEEYVAPRASYGGKILGVQNPDFIIVGEQVNPNHGGKYPFCSSIGCSPWLSKELASTGVPETRLAWTNAYDTRGIRLTGSEVKLCDPRNIVTLGRVAGNWADDQGLDHVNFEHPAYHKRFKSSRDYPLTLYLGDVNAGLTDERRRLSGPGVEKTT